MSDNGHLPERPPSEFLLSKAKAKDAARAIEARRECEPAEDYIVRFLRAFSRGDEG